SEPHKHKAIYRPKQDAARARLTLACRILSTHWDILVIVVPSPAAQHTPTHTHTHTHTHTTHTNTRGHTHTHKHTHTHTHPRTHTHPVHLHRATLTPTHLSQSLSAPGRACLMSKSLYLALNNDRACQWTFCLYCGVA